jgi:hypothetical protein
VFGMLRLAMVDVWATRRRAPTSRAARTTTAALRTCASVLRRLLRARRVARGATARGTAPGCRALDARQPGMATVATLPRSSAVGFLESIDCLLKVRAAATPSALFDAESLASDRRLSRAGGIVGQTRN